VAAALLPIDSGAITLAPVHESRDPNGDAFDRAGTIAFSAALLSRLLVRPEDFA
jgi:hypothetical protein